MSTSAKVVSSNDLSAAFPQRSDRSLYIFAFLKHILQPGCQSDHLITVVHSGFRGVAHRDAVIAFACRAHALPVACAGLIELHGWTVLQGDEKAGTSESRAARNLNKYLFVFKHSIILFIPLIVFIC